MIHDLKCENGHLHDRVFYRGSRPPCPECGAPTTISWHTGGAPGLSGLQTFDVDGQQMTTPEINAKVNRIAKERPNARITVTPPSDRATDERIASIRQRQYEHRKKNGWDIKSHIERQVEAEERKIEALDRGKMATRDVHRDIAKAERNIQRQKKSAETTL